MTRRRGKRERGGDAESESEAEYRPVMVSYDNDQGTYRQHLHII